MTTSLFRFLDEESLFAQIRKIRSNAVTLVVTLLIAIGVPVATTLGIMYAILHQQVVMGIVFGFLGGGVLTEAFRYLAWKSRQSD